MKNIAIILAGGNGSRMNNSIPKQYIKIENRPILSYSIEQFSNCSFIDEIILVTRAEDIEYCRREFYNSKITAIVAGGSERYESVINGLDAIDEDGYVFIHDGARPCISAELISRIYEDVQKYDAVIPAVVAKDTVRIADENGNVINTPDRTGIRLCQTPQTFRTSLIKKAYAAMKENKTSKTITDDAMVLEEFTGFRAHITEGEYSNIKVTTPEDVSTVKSFLKK